MVELVSYALWEECPAKDTLVRKAAGIHSMQHGANDGRNSVLFASGLLRRDIAERRETMRLRWASVLTCAPSDPATVRRS